MSEVPCARQLQFPKQSMPAHGLPVRAQSDDKIWRRMHIAVKSFPANTASNITENSRRKGDISIQVSCAFITAVVLRKYVASRVLDILHMYNS